MNENIWDTLYNQAVKMLNPRRISPFITAGEVGSALITKSGNIYTGANIDTACGLGNCAERSAIIFMISHGENQIDKLVCVMADKSVGMPCGACREYMMQLCKDSKNTEILININTKETTTLSQLLGSWWGDNRWDNV